mgnify:CR=1 FL=1
MVQCVCVCVCVCVLCVLVIGLQGTVFWCVFITSGSTTFAAIPVPLVVFVCKQEYICVCVRVLLVLVSVVGLERTVF